MQNKPGSKRPDNVPILIWIGVSLGLGALYVGQHNQYIGLTVAMGGLAFLMAGIIRWGIAGSNMAQLRDIEEQQAEIIQLLRNMQTQTGENDSTEPSTSSDVNQPAATTTEAQTAASDSSQGTSADGDSDVQDDPRHFV